MIHPIPTGTRDVLPDEMREQRAITDGLHGTFDAAGYGEVWTPMLEYEEVLGSEPSGASGYRLFDDQGEVLALRSDMTLPIARLAATRYRDAESPLRLSYFGHAYRSARRGSGHATEFLQAGIELLGVSGPDGEAEVISVLLDSLEAAGLTRHRVGLGDSALYRVLMADLEVPAEHHAELLGRLADKDLVGLEMSLDNLGMSDDARPLLARLPEMRGGAEMLKRAHAMAGPALDGLADLYARLEERGIADRVIVDLGLVRHMSYYTGPVYEVYDPAVGFTLGGGGRYDDLVGRFGDPRPACGFALDVARVHVARAAEGGLR